MGLVATTAIIPALTEAVASLQIFRRTKRDKRLEVVVVE